MNAALLEIDVIEKSITRSTVMGLNLGLDIKESIFGDKQISLVDALTATVAVQIALVDLLKHLGVKPDGIIGHSFGEIVAAYADGCLTSDQSLLVAHTIGKQLTCTLNGCIANGLDLENLTLLGDKYSIHKHISDAVDSVLLNQKVLRTTRSSQWLSSCIPDYKWHETESSRLSGEYFASSLVSKVNFKDILFYIPKNAVIIELGLKLSMQSILRKGLGPDVVIVPLLGKAMDNANCLSSLANSFGELYASSVNLHIEKLYPKVEYPVSRGTLSISPLIKWDHSKSCIITKHPEYFNVVSSSAGREIDIMQATTQYLAGHVIDGRNLVPAVEYLRVAWEQLVAMTGNYYKRVCIYKTY